MRLLITTQIFLAASLGCVAQYQYTNEQEDSLTPLFNFYGEEAMKGIIEPRSEESKPNWQNLEENWWTHTSTEYGDAVETHFYYYLGEDDVCKRVRWVWQRGEGLPSVITEYFFDTETVRLIVYEAAPDSASTILAGNGGKCAFMRTAEFSETIFNSTGYEEYKNQKQLSLQERVDLQLCRELLRKARKPIVVVQTETKSTNGKKAEQYVPPKSDRAGG